MCQIHVEMPNTIHPAYLRVQIQKERAENLLDPGSEVPEAAKKLEVLSVTETSFLPLHELGIMVTKTNIHNIIFCPLR